MQHLLRDHRSPAVRPIALSPGRVGATGGAPLDIVSAMKSWRRRATVILVGGLVVAGCTRPEDQQRSNATSDTSVAASPDTVETTTASDGTESTTPTTPGTTDTSPTTQPTTPPTTAPAPPTTQGSTSTTSTTPPDSPDDLVLTFDSIGPWKFGDRDVDVVPGLAAILGSPVDDVLTEYPVADEGSFLDENGELSYVAPFGRTVCFDGELCAQFGAGAPETLILTGWRLSEGASGDLVTDDGVAVGSTWAEHVDVITIDPLDSCFQIGNAEAGGVDVVLLSTGEPFATADDAGEFVAGDPDPAQTTVIELRAGRHPTFVFADC